MPAAELQRIIRDLSQFGDSTLIACTKEGVQFSASGDLGTAKVSLRQNTTADKPEEEVCSVVVCVHVIGVCVCVCMCVYVCVCVCVYVCVCVCVCVSFLAALHTRYPLSFKNQSPSPLPLATSPFSLRPHPSLPPSHCH